MRTTASRWGRCGGVRQKRYVRSSRGQKPGMPGSRDQADQTRRVQLPPEETGPVPVSLARAEPRWFGVPPPMLLLGLAVLSLAIAVALFAVGRWPFGLILLGLTAFLAAGFLQVARRPPDEGDPPTPAPVPEPYPPPEEDSRRPAA